MKKINETELRIGSNLVQAGILTKILTLQTFVENGSEITPEQFMILFTLFEHGDLNQREIATILMKDRPNINRYISILEKNNFVTKTIETTGRNVSKISMTDKGKTVFNKVLPIITRVWEIIHSEISDDELETFLKTLNKIKATIKSKVNMQI